MPDLEPGYVPIDESPEILRAAADALLLYYTPFSAHNSAKSFGIAGTTLATLHWHSMITETAFITLACVLLAIICTAILRSRRLLMQRLGY